MWYMFTLISAHAFCWHMGCHRSSTTLFTLFLPSATAKGFWSALVFVCKERSGSETFVFGRWVITCSNSVLGIHVFDIIWTREPSPGYLLKSSWCLFTDQESPDSVRSGWKTLLRIKWWWCRLLNFRKKNIRTAHREVNSCNILLSDVIFAFWS